MTTPRLRLMESPRPERPVRVLFLIDSLGPGGAERLMIDLLPRLVDLGVEPQVVAIQERNGNVVAPALERLGFPVSVIGIERLRERGALDRVISTVVDASPDVIHTQLEFADILGTIAGHRLGIPTIATIHTMDRPRRWSREAARFRLMAWTLRRRADRIVAVSESARRHVLSRAGLPKRRTITIHNGIELEPYLLVGDDERRAIRDELGLGADHPVVTTVAVLRRLKGIQYMLDAVPVLLEDHPRLRYVVVGDGAYRDELVTRAASLGISDHVVFTGARSDVAAVMAAGDLHVHPSLTEALPTVVIEAMAARRPVVATDVGGTSEVLTAGGLLVPPRDTRRLADAVGRLLAHPRQRTALGLAGRRTASERFSIERQARRLADEYRVLATTGGR